MAATCGGAVRPAGDVPERRGSRHGPCCRRGRQDRWLRRLRTRPAGAGLFNLDGLLGDRLRPILTERILGDDLTPAGEADPRRSSMAHRMIDGIFPNPKDRHYWLIAGPGELAAAVVLDKQRVSIRWVTSTIGGTTVRVYQRGLLVCFTDGSMVGVRMRPWSAVRSHNAVR